jgi:hypothetical protein
MSKLERGLASLAQLTWSWLALGGSREELARVLAARLSDDLVRETLEQTRR